MAFNDALARSLIEGDDRDTAPFFAGRHRELESVRTALEQAPHKAQTVFRVFQGPPGCGKTSLLDYVARLHADDPQLLFVRPSKADLASPATVMECVADAALERSRRSDAKAAGEVLVNYGALALRSLGEAVRMKSASDAVREWRRRQAIEHMTAVLVFDEAQNLGAEQREAIESLHKDGLPGLPSVLLLGGLTHTADRLGELGISRPASNAIVNMGRLARAESVESTATLLDELDPGGAAEKRATLATLAAEVSFDWPQHLNRAQWAVCVELRRVDGDADRSERQRIRQDTETARRHYYEGRVSGTVLGREPHIAWRVIDEVGRNRLRSLEELASLCQDAAGRGSRIFEFDAASYATALVEKGVVGRTDDYSYTVPIPSMVDWAKECLQAHER